MKTPEDADFAALLLMVIALGAQYAGKNPQSRFKPLMDEFSVDLGSLTASLIHQVRSHLINSLEHCQIEAVQTCVLLGTYYIYHGNPNLSWLERRFGGTPTLQIHLPRSFTVDHLPWIETFAISRTPTNSTIREYRYYLRTLNDGHPVSKLYYHTCKYVLYDIKAQIISKIYTLRARASFQATTGGIQKLVNVVQAFDKKLKSWHDQIPPFFKRSKWTSGDGDPSDIFNDLHEALPEYQERMKDHLIMQTVALQLLYDYILILLHRPLLEYRMSS
ncbi:uncharacterized protein PAC_18785 [Phialocephala subalpina]|uniref:Xylanolytic transcriptional activator regulatory domain-containing protein n=1 Tax=Phialocephala subalpina TaxID=576137 RepID=A0A1L7XV08_9HELO|nr:uncharacterized protein PAC_18785 [Phialocephala subalpina]